MLPFLMPVSITAGNIREVTFAAPVAKLVELVSGSQLRNPYSGSAWGRFGADSPEKLRLLVFTRLRSAGSRQVRWYLVGATVPVLCCMLKVDSQTKTPFRELLIL